MEDPKKKRRPETTPPSTPEGTASPVSRRTIWLIILFVIGTLLVVNYLQTPVGIEEIPYSELKERVRQGEVESVTLTEELVTATPTEEARDSMREELGDDQFQMW
ncbi:MAG: ATP-dependent metallopeptidase FtsH/Yme1/Tma family protein, partial [Bradymonadaceae bacterium]